VPALGRGQGAFREIGSHQHGKGGCRQTEAGAGRCNQHKHQRRRRADQDFGREELREGDATQACPAGLARPDFAKCAQTERLLEGRGDQIDVQPEPVDQLGRRGILGNLGGKRADIAIGFEHGLVPQHALALGETEAERLPGILPARLQRVEESAFDLRPEPVRPRADRRRADKAGVRLPCGHQMLKIVLRHKDVGIGKNDPFVTRRLPTLDAIVEFRIAADAVIADE
jgi:hypothetical protein